MIDLDPRRETNETVRTALAEILLYIGLIALFFCGEWIPGGRLYAQDCASASDCLKTAEALSNDRALQYYQRAALLQPANGFFHARLGQHYYKRMRDYRHALDSFRTARAHGFRQDWAVLQQVSTLSILADIEFGNDRFQEAELYLREAVSVNSTERFSTLATRQKLMIRSIALPVRPAEFRHRLLVILLTEIRTGMPNFDGVLSQIDIENTRNSVEGLKNYTEALSQKKLTIEYDFLTIQTPVTRLAKSSDTSALLNIEELTFDTKEIALKIPDYDTFLFIWPAHTFQASKGGAGRLSGIGESQGVWRGVMQIPAMRMAADGPSLTGSSLVLHEFFHVLERLIEIKPEHGFQLELRKNFPGWTGNDELDYYDWHFHSTIPAQGWQLLNFRARYPVQIH